MDPAHVMRCFGVECERRQPCARYAALILSFDACYQHERTGLNVCIESNADRFIPLRQSHSHVTTPVYGTHGHLPHPIPASEKQGGNPNL